jgi:hypothetical protein
MVGPFCPQLDAGSVSEPETTSLRLLLWHLESLQSPDPLDPLVVDNPAGGRTQKFCDLPVAAAAILTGKRDDVDGKPFPIVLPARNTSLRRTMLAEHAADPELGQLQLRSNVRNADGATGGAYQFPEVASFRISLSKVRSATARPSRAFSVSRSFKRLT